MIVKSHNDFVQLRVAFERLTLDCSALFDVTLSETCELFERLASSSDGAKIYRSILPNAFSYDNSKHCWTFKGEASEAWRVYCAARLLSSLGGESLPLEATAWLAVVKDCRFPAELPEEAQVFLSLAKHSASQQRRAEIDVQSFAC